MTRVLVDRALDAASEVLTLVELDDHSLPLLVEALGASGSLLFEFGDDGQPRGVAGSLAPHIMRYNAMLYGRDPVQDALRKPLPSGPTLELDDVVPYRSVCDTVAFQEFYRPLRAERLIGILPTRLRFGTPGMVGLLLGRPRSDRGFSARERRAFARVIPALRAVIARQRKLGAAEREHAYLRAALAVSRRATFVLDRRGRVLFASPAAHEEVRRWPALPRAIADAVGRSGTVARVLSSGHRVELASTRLDDGTRVTTANVTPLDAQDVAVEAVARAHGLTRAETAVLGCVARGFGNRVIAAELHVAEATVKTHVRQILAKLGVANRTQAATRVLDGSA